MLDGELAPQIEVDVGTRTTAAELADAPGPFVSSTTVSEERLQPRLVGRRFHFILS
jgi:hypothetical protein